MRIQLVINEGKYQGTVVEIKRDLFLIGNDPACQLRINAPGISRQHCAVVTRTNKVFVRNLGSGEAIVKVNDQLVGAGEEMPLHANDSLTVGPAKFKVVFKEKQLHQRDAEEWALKALDQAFQHSEHDADEGDPLTRALESRPSSAADAAAQLLAQFALQRGVVRGRLRIGEEHGVTTIRFNDIHLVEEAEIQSIKKELLQAIQRPRMRVLLDFKNVKRMSSAAAEMIREVYHLVTGNRGQLALCRIRPELLSGLEEAGLLKLIRHFRDKNAAVQLTEW
ncbi:MAG: FHA domain-containing protein [Gemmatales bacterium]|nr:FHA domain-containing protein [Gemmatales bacterium]MDW8175232.1 FHA domain-containing protein [Gemmatales bacterium]